MSARFAIVTAVLLFFLASQFYWFYHFSRLVRRLIPNRLAAWLVRLGVLAALTLLFFYNLNFFKGGSPTYMTLKVALLEVPFKLWFFGSLTGFILAIPFLFVDAVIAVVRGGYRRLVTRRIAPHAPKPVVPGSENPHGPRLPLPSRRRFLEQAAMAVGAMPFAVGAYGLLYERLDLETTHQRIWLRRLPKAFDGFRIAQLSDIHIGPFMTENQIRKAVAVANGFKPDLIALTGDFVTWDPSTQEAVVRALSGLKAPYGVFGCLGNHEAWSRTEDSITRLFGATGTKILRHERALITAQNESLNLIGVDFQTHMHMGPKSERAEHYVRTYLAGVETLVAPDTANILLSHNPNTFDRAAELGIDLSLAGHTHGGQVSLEFVNKNISPSRLITSYVKGWFRKDNAQLYVNRGIGTIGVPIRIGAPPEITVFELRRDA